MTLQGRHKGAPRGLLHTIPGEPEAAGLGAQGPSWVTLYHILLLLSRQPHWDGQMGPRWSLLLVGLLSGSAWSSVLRAAPASSGAGRSPSFVVILMDDVGWGDWGSYWAETTETSFLDGLANRALRFTDFHSAASVCTPSRAGLLTGRLGLRTGVTKNFEHGSLFGLPQTEIMLPEVLRWNGYKTAMVGKWHLGFTAGYHPTYRGFERYLGVPYSVDMGCTDVPGEDHPPLSTCCTAASYKECHNAPAVPLYNSTGLNCTGHGNDGCNADIEEQPVNLTTLSGRYAAYAERFLSEQADSDKPFFLYMAMSHMHVPLAHDPRFDNASSRSDRQAFGDALVEADNEIRRVVEALERHGLANDTLVVISSDNGPWNQKCQLSGLQGPYEGRYLMDTHQTGSGKFSCWEGGHRVPTLAYWPGVIQPGVSDSLSSLLDVFPTFLSLAGLPLPSDRSYDGIDLSPLLLRGQPTNATEHRTLFHPDQRGQLSAMRLGPYKMHFRVTQAPPCSPSDLRPVDDVLDGFPFVLDDEGPLLFDLAHDPHEANPIQPSAELQSELQRLLEEKLWDIEHTFRSTADFTEQDDPQHWPCCGADQPACRCPLDGGDGWDGKALHVSVNPYDEAAGAGTSPAF